MATDQTPQLPHGGFSILSTLSQSLSFHSSPESFISSRARDAALRLSDQAPREEGASPPRIVRARILNRNVAVVSSYQICEDVLKVGSGERQNSVTAAIPGQTIGPNTFAVQSAYLQLMSDFFPPPNILLIDQPDHHSKRHSWEEQLSFLLADTCQTIHTITNDHFSTWSHGDSIDIYDSMKDLSWKVLLSVFLQLSPTDKAYSTVESLQETLLRGQFSLMPVSKGIEARQKLQTLLKDHIASQDTGCPLLRQAKLDKDEISANALMFTSSIAVKALASLLTASMLNLFLLPYEPSLVARVRTEDPGNRNVLLNSILLETERLSPPVVGVMRRVQQDVVLASPEGQPPTLIPSGWDIWLYFVSAARDKTAYELADKFLPERFISQAETKPGYAFGSGSKSCLGQSIIRDIVHSVASAALDANVDLEGSVTAEGVREAFARDLKQLPCQRPKEAIHLRVYRG
ncbi:cytochrome P450 [Calycina marina]|uniref:Cytochrome P450 n=1 Tax=Calycina marina TaxID=1763456 RepID=A0A9P8CDL5_9HELO|nr:cytochrome P450 [Calycina marina]